MNKRFYRVIVYRNKRKSPGRYVSWMFYKGKLAVCSYCKTPQINCVVGETELKEALKNNPNLFGGRKYKIVQLNENE